MTESGSDALGRLFVRTVRRRRRGMGHRNSPVCLDGASEVMLPCLDGLRLQLTALRPLALTLPAAAAASGRRVGPMVDRRMTLMARTHNATRATRATVFVRCWASAGQ